MKYPRSTGQAAIQLDTTEPRLNDLIRRGKIYPAPSVASGRRMWDAIHIRQAARILGISDIERRLEEEVA